MHYQRDYDEEIERSIKFGNNLQFTENKIEEIFKTQLTKFDKLRIEESYGKLLIKLFLQDASEQIVSPINPKLVSTFVDKLNSVNSYASLKHFVDHFPLWFGIWSTERTNVKLPRTLGVFIFLLNSQSTLPSLQNREEYCINRFKVHCLIFLQIKITVFKDEQCFYAKILEIFQLTKDPAQLCSDLNLLPKIECLENNFNFKVFLQNVIKLKSNQHVSKQVQKLANKIVDQDYFFLNKELFETIYSYLIPTIIEEKNIDGRVCLEVSGKHIVISKVIDEVERKLIRIDEVRFVNSDVIHIDKNLTNSVWHGKNIILLAKSAIVNKEVNWDVSGKHGEITYNKSEADCGDDGYGLPGNNGQSGESGGNVVFIVDLISDANNFSIKSNGGNGSNGQNGGQGRHGANGFFLEKGDFLKSFPPVSKFWNSGKDEYLEITKNIVLHLFQSLEEFYAGNVSLGSMDKGEFGELLSRYIKERNNFFFKLKTNDGCTITFSFFYEGIFTLCQSYLLHEGAYGEEGKQGGGGGLGGPKGYAGEITILVDNALNTNIVTCAKDGKDGITGKKGLSGIPGTKGADRGYLDCTIGFDWPKMIIPNPVDNKCLKLSYSSEAGSNKVFDPHNCKYAEIVTKDNLGFFQTCLNPDMCNPVQSTTHVMRKKTVNIDSIKRQYNQNFSGANLSKLRTITESAAAHLANVGIYDTSEIQEVSAETKVIRMSAYSPNGQQQNYILQMHSQNTCNQSPGFEEDTIQWEYMEFDVNNLIETIKIDPTNIQNWLQLSSIPLNLTQLQGLWEIAYIHVLGNTCISNVLSDQLKDAFCKKYHLAILEGIANVFDTNEIDKSQRHCVDISKLICMPFYDLNKLFIRHVGIISNTITGKYLVEDCKTQRLTMVQKVRDCLENPSHVVSTSITSSDVVSATLIPYLNEYCSSSNELIKLKKEIELFSKLKEQKLSSRFGAFKSALKRQNGQALYTDLTKCVVSKNNVALVETLNKMNKDQLLHTLYRNMVITRHDNYNWGKIAETNSRMYEDLLKSFEDDGPLKVWYREFLAYYHNINIVIYSMIKENQFELTYNHNPHGLSSEYFLLQNNKFECLELNKKYVEMILLYNTKSKLFKRIVYYVDSLVEKQQIDDFVSKMTSSPDFIIDVCVSKSVAIRNKFIRILTEDNNIKQILNSYTLEDDKEMVRNRLEKLKQGHTGCSNILYYVALRFENEGNHMSAKELACIVNFILKCTSTFPNVVPLVSWIIGAYSQVYWLVEIMLLKLEVIFKKAIRQKLKSEWRICLCKRDERNKFILLMEKICEESLNISEENLSETIYLLSNISLSIQANDVLKKLDLDEWRYYLKGKFWGQQLSNITEWSHKNLIMASHYLVKLENVFGTELCKSLIEVLKEPECGLVPKATNKIPDIFKAITNKEVCLNEEMIKQLKSIKVVDWMGAIEKKSLSKDEERSLDLLVDIVEKSSNTSSSVKEKLRNIYTAVSQCNSTLEDLKSNLKSNVQFQAWAKEVSRMCFQGHIWSISDIIPNVRRTFSITDETLENAFKSIIHKYFYIKAATNQLHCDEFKQESAFGCTLETLLASATRAVEITRNVTLRDAQKLAAITILKSDKLLSQIATGEGKSFVIVLVAIVKALKGQKVDIITSNRVLAERDAKEYKDVYNMFDITVGHNCSENIEERRQMYANSTIVYGDLVNFQRDYLLDRIYNEQNIMSDRSFETVLLDEVDSMLLDKGTNTLYLSHEIPGLDKLEPVFIYIWRALHVPIQSDHLKAEQIVSALKLNILHNMFQLVTKEDLMCLNSSVGEKEVDNTWNYLVKEGFIDKSGKVVRQGNVVNFQQIPENCLSQDLLEYYFKKLNRSVKSLKVPNYLTTFIEAHLNKWIKSCMRAMVMEPGTDYVIDIDRSEACCDRSPNIIIIDKVSGADLTNSQWENGLHQFLQLKHGCRLSLVSLKAVFMSNVSFLKRYKLLFGLTGTLGTKLEQDLLKDIYKVEFIEIPTAKTKCFSEEEPIMCSGTEAWCSTIFDEAIKKIEDHRSVLIVCDTVNDVHLLEKEFKGFYSLKRDANPKNNIHTYVRDYEKLTVAEKLDGGHIIIATNLAGRGTDVKLTEGLINAGGLHVCLSYLPCNIRIMEQAFGRASRNGQPGSGQMIINNYTPVKMTQLEQQRDIDERYRIRYMKSYYNLQIEMEESCFDRFQMVYKMIKDSDCHPESIKKIILQTSLDQWAFWLEAHSNSLDSENLIEFLNKVEQLKESEFEKWSRIVTDPFQLIKLGLAYLGVKDYEKSISLFDRVIKEEPLFAEGAYYYSLVAKSRKINISTEDISTEDILCDINKVLLSLNEHKQNLYIAAHVIDYQKQKNPSSNLIIESFKQQQLEKAQICDVFVHSILEITGFEIKFEDFILETVIENEETARIVFSDLTKEKVIKESRFKDNLSPADFSPFAVKYGLSTDELYSHLKEYKGKTFDETSVLNKLQEKLCLPSRELFWSKLILNKVLVKEKEICIINLLKLKQVDPSLRNILITKLTAYNRRGNEIMLYQPMEMGFMSEDQCLLVLRKHLKTHIPDWKYTNLINKRVICLNKVATWMNCPVDIEFDCFNCIKREDFQRIEIPSTIASEIIQELEDNRIIKKKEGKEEHALLLNDSNLRDFVLSLHPALSDDVKSLLKHCFAFRIAIQIIQSNNADDRDQFGGIPLPIRVCNNIINDLKEHGIVSKVTVNPIGKDIFKTIDKLYPENMSLEKYSDLFKELYDKDTSDKIVISLVENKCLLQLNDDSLNFGISINGNYVSPLPPELEVHKETILFILNRQLKLTSEAKTHIARLIKSRESALYKHNTSGFSLEPLLDALRQNDLPTFESRIFSLNGMDQVLKIEEKKYTLKMIMGTASIAITGLMEIVVGTYLKMQMHYSSVGQKLISEGISDLIFAVRCGFSGVLNWTEFLIMKAISIVYDLVSYLAPLQAFKSFFGMKVSGGNCVTSSIKSQGLVAKATSFINTLFKDSSTSTVNTNLVVKTLVTRVATQTVIGCSTVITIGTIENYLLPKLEKISEECVKIILSKNDDVDNPNLWTYVRKLYLLLGEKEATKLFKFCCLKVADERGNNIKSDLAKYVKHLRELVDTASTMWFREFKDLGNVFNLLSVLLTIIQSLCNLMKAGEFFVMLQKGNSEAIFKLIQSLENKLKIKVEELQIKQTNVITSEKEAANFVSKAKEDLEEYIKEILTDSINKTIMSPIAALLTRKCVRYLSNIGSGMLKREDKNDFIRINKDKFQMADSDLTQQSDIINQLNYDYSEVLLGLLDRNKHIGIYLELLKSENNCSVNRLFMEYSCFVITMALRENGLRAPLISVIIENDGVKEAYGYPGEDPDVLTVTITPDQGLRTNLQKNKMSIKYFINTIYKNILPFFVDKGLTSELLHAAVLTGIEKCTIDFGKSDNNLSGFFNRFGNMMEMKTLTDSRNPHTSMLVNSTKNIKVIKNFQSSKTYLVKYFELVLKKINDHLHKVQPHLRFLYLTIEDFDETDYVTIPSHEDIPGQHFDSYVSSYELINVPFTQEGSDLLADYKITMRLEIGKNQSHIMYAVEPMDRKGQLGKGMSGSIKIDMKFDYVYAVKDCHQIGEIITDGSKRTAGQRNVWKYQD